MKRRHRTLHVGEKRANAQLASQEISKEDIDVSQSSSSMVWPYSLLGSFRSASLILFLVLFLSRRLIIATIPTHISTPLPSQLAN